MRVYKLTMHHME